MNDALIERVARAVEPWVWALDPPDVSSANARRASLVMAQRYIDAYKAAISEAGYVVVRKMEENTYDHTQHPMIWAPRQSSKPSVPKHTPPHPPRRKA